MLILARQARVATTRGLSFEPLRKVKPEAAEVVELWPAVIARPRAAEPASASARWKASPAAEEPAFDPLSRENFARICARFDIRVISILPSTRRSRGQGQASADILVEFEPGVKLDYTLVFRLRQELFAVVGHPVDLVCRNSAEPETLERDLRVKRACCTPRSLG